MNAWRTWVAISVVCSCSALAHATPVNLDLNQFFSLGNVGVSADGSTATLAEDQEFGIALLSNDPTLGDPVLITPAAGLFLAFDYVFTEGELNDDTFSAYVIHPLDGPFAPGSPFSLDLDTSSSGTALWDLGDLSALSFVGLEFDLFSGDDLLGSRATISNVRLVRQPSNVVPEPATMSLFSLGCALFGLRHLRSKRERRFVNKLNIEKCKI